MKKLLKTSITLFAAVSILGATGSLSAQTKVSEEGESVTLQLVHQGRVTDCAATPSVSWCVSEVWIERLREKSHGRLNITMTSLPELGLAGPDVLRLVGDGTLQMAEVYSGYIAGDVPFVDINNLWGLYPSLEVQLETMDAVADEIAAEVAKQNGTIVSYSYYPPNYLYTSRKINGVADFKGLKTRSHSTVLSDMLSGIGADGQFIAFAEVYSALERGVVEGAIASVDGALIAHWYEVTDYMVGPVVALAQTWITMNKDVFDGMPDDLRALLIEEGVWRDKENRMRLFRDLPKLVQLLKDKGMEESGWPDGAIPLMKDAAVNLILPAWVERTGGPDSDAVRVFNEKVAPILGVRVLADGSAEQF